MGAKVCLIEEQQLGGTCLNVGCIPTKALHKSAQILREVQDAPEFGIEVTGFKVNFTKIMQRKSQIVKQLVDGVAYLLKRGGIEVIKGSAKFVSPTSLELVGTGQRIEARKIIIATGTANAIPPIPGVHGQGVIDSTQALALADVPKSLVVIGGGVIGCEFASIYRALGSDVVVIEMLPSLISNIDEECSQILEKRMKQMGIKLYLKSKVIEICDVKGQKLVRFDTDEGVKEAISDLVLLSVGRSPRTAGLGLEAAGVNTDRGWIVVNEMMQTNIEHIFAAGDVTGKELFAHVAYAEAEVAVDNALGSPKKMDYRAVPKAIFTFPEISSVGLSEKEAREQGYEVISSKFPLRGNGKALILGESDGFVKVIADKKFNEVLGMHIVGPQASELIAEATLAISMEATLDDIAQTIHAHPSVAETVKEVAMSALGRALHT